MNIIKIESCASTNSFLKDLSEKQVLEEGTLVATNQQVKGKGQAGNYWEAEPGKNITMSMVLFPNFLEIGKHFLLSEVIALGVKDVLDSYTQEISVKWPNDIYYQNKKLGGILIENDIMGQTISRSIVGIGINVNQEIFRPETPNPISIKQITGKETNLNTLLEQISDSISIRYKQLRNKEFTTIVDDYHRALYRSKGFYLFKDFNHSFFAEIESVGEDGFLHLRNDKGEPLRYAFKEVSFMNYEL